MTVSTKHAKFFDLVKDVQACTSCIRMKDSLRVLNHSAGNLNARAMFIGEAPGRLGADSTGIPFHGDTAGNNFEDLLSFSGLSRGEIFVTNAALCNPKDEKGNNSTPLPTEVRQCSSFLKRQIELINPQVVVTLGATALGSLENIESHKLELRNAVRTKNNWFGRILIPLYHPGQRAMIHRSFANQRSDYQFVSDTLKQLTQPKRRSASPTSKADVLALVRSILEAKGAISYFELHKLAYLVEYLHVKRTGGRLTNAYFIRQKDGPYCTDLQLSRLQKAAPWLKVAKSSNQLILSCASGNSKSLFSDREVSESIAGTIDEAIRRYSYDSESELKTAVYLTAPMRNLLRREKIEKLNMFNAPIDFLTAH
ncbi:MAG: uracil-DNA glycosylase [Burkholderiales bacterium]|nr:uracil-DNA glycosylase [Burkholderiales bacterium]